MWFLSTSPSSGFDLTFDYSLNLGIFAAILFSNIRRRNSAAAVDVLAGSSVNAAVPPKGPIGFWLLLSPSHWDLCYTRTRHMGLQVTPAGIWIVTGKSLAVVNEIPAIPGTFCVTYHQSLLADILTSACWKLFPVPVGSMKAFMGPAPSWLTWCIVTLISPFEVVGNWPALPATCFVASWVQSSAPDSFVRPQPFGAPRLKIVVSCSKGLGKLPSRGVFGSTPKAWPVTVF